MLFDLRSRGRRTTVKVIYLGLALLIGVGLVGFGIGGGFGGGGLLTAASNNEGGGAGGFGDQVAKYRKLTRQQPNNVAAWENLTRYLLHESAAGEAYVTSNGEVTSKGKALYREAASAWTSYISLNPPKPNAELAQLMTSVYGVQGLNEPSKAVQVLQLVVAARPESAALWAQLAEYAYKAHQTPIGDEASAKAVKLAPAEQRNRLKNELAQLRKSPNGAQTYTTTANGKTYAVKPSGEGGTYTGTAIKITPPPAPKSTTKKK
jgi:hypothetical protein